MSKSRKHIAQLEELSARLEEAERARWLAEARAQQERQAFESLASFASSKLGYDWAAFDEDGDWYEGFVHPGSHTPDGWGVCIFSDDGGCYIGVFPLCSSSCMRSFAFVLFSFLLVQCTYVPQM